MIDTYDKVDLVARVLATNWTWEQALALWFHPTVLEDGHGESLEPSLALVRED
jgi:hypothetical protein